ncbi:zinc uptake protein ZrgA [Vibrio atypicus]|uniref:zinc uptake protein ZrgA n=1 Tax=Vibrio atypicus TaxID=558271 RepID=UPI00135992D7|nr:DUF2796 domain-containing protein [Vibrio atypicus]
MYKLSPLAALVALTISHSVVAEEGFRQHDAHVHGEVELNIAQDGQELLIEITAPGADVVGFEHAPENDQQKQTLAQAVKTLNSANLVFSLTQAADCQLSHYSVSHTLEDKHGEHNHDEHHDHKGHGEHDHDEHHDHKGHDDHDHDEHHDHKGHDDHNHDEHHDHKGHDDHDHDEHHDHKGHDDHDHDEHHDHKGHDDHDHDEHHDHKAHSGHGEFTVEYHYQCGDITKLNAIETSWFKLFPATEALKVNLLTDEKQEALRLQPKQSVISL